MDLKSTVPDMDQLFCGVACIGNIFYILYMGSVVWFMDAPAEVVQDSIYCTVCGMPWLFAVIEACIASRINSKGEDNLDYIIVLGAMIREDGPSSILKARLDSAIEYLDGNPGTKCIVSGGQGYDEPCSEAEGMRKYLVEKGIDESRIIMEPDSMNTIQNIRNSKAIIDNDNAKVGIVTSKFHVYRAVKIAEKQGFKNVSGISAYVVASYMPSNMFREFLAWLRTLCREICKFKRT